MNDGGVLPHAHAVALRVWAGQIQFETVGVGREPLRDLDEFLNRPAENRNQQEPLRRQRDLLKLTGEAVRARIRQADRVHEAARRVLRENRLAVAFARARADAFRRQHAELRNLAGDALQRLRVRRNHARRNGEPA